MVWKLFRSLTLAAVALAASIALVPQGATAGSEEVVVYAAASLKNALDDVKALWQRETGKRVTVSYAASSALAKQIEAGAPADIFVSADLDWMDYVAGKGLIRPDTRVDLLGNRLVLIAPKDAAVAVALEPGLDLSPALGKGRLALANVDSVPAGKYGRAALEKLGAWDGVKNQTAQGENVRSALLLVARGECPLGIVYATDAAADPSVRVVATFPKDTHPEIVYPVAVTKDSRHSDAAEFLAYMRSATAKGVFENQGFAVLNRPSGS
jgi:molybdate transport system substrate-binding protein